jgi:glycosyltransferase involved in cell wall biosynthesis
MPRSRPVLTVIQSTHASLEGFRATGLFERHARLLQEYAQHFQVVVYSSDEMDWSTALGVEHRAVPWLPRQFGLRHAIYYLWLVHQAPHMRGVIKVVGSNIPTLPLVKRLSGCPMVVTYQYDYAGFAALINGPGSWQAWLARRMQALALRPADQVFVTTPTLEAKAQRLGAKATLLVPNWVDFRQIDADQQAVRDPSRILFAGRLHPTKGLHVLLKAFALVKTQHPEASLVLCGAGQERDRLEAAVRSQDLVSVIFTGRRLQADVLGMMRRAAIFVLPTLTSEGHPKALIEAMACGAVCVATDVEGNRDVITCGEDGWLVPPGQPEALGQAILRLLDDASLRERLSRQAQANARRYDFGAVVPHEIAALEALAPR